MAFSIGIHVAEFWELTIGEFTRCLDGYKDLVERQNKRQDHLNHILGNYIATGVNNPKKYPKEPYLSEDKEETKQIAITDAQRQAIVRIKYGKK